MKKVLFLIMVVTLLVGCESNDNGNNDIVCKRAKTLHKEECRYTSKYEQCRNEGYDEGELITYGSLGTPGTLKSGDAFDCDVNGDGKYEAEKERFYYVSDLYDTKTNTFNSDYAVLIYYNNTVKGVADNSSLSKNSYCETQVNYYGPTNAIKELPTIKQWSNVSLASVSRAISNEKNGFTNEYGGFTYELPIDFKYVIEEAGEKVPLAARLLTVQEVLQACETKIFKTPNNWYLSGTTEKCKYLKENTKYSSETMGTYGYLLETSYSYSNSEGWAFTGLLNDSISTDEKYHGIRPVIEVLKTDISY